MRFAHLADDQADAQLEVAAYRRMHSLQGVHVPRLKAHGYTLGGRTYFVATELIQVSMLLLLALHRLRSASWFASGHQLHNQRLWLCHVTCSQQTPHPIVPT